MRQLHPVIIGLSFILYLPSVVFGEQENSTGSIACLQKPIALPAAGLKYTTTTKETRNGLTLETVIYDFELRPANKKGNADDCVIALLVPKTFDRYRADLQKKEVLQTQECVIHIMSSMVQSIPVSTADITHKPAQILIAELAKIPSEQRQANQEIIGLLLFRLETYPATRPASVDKAAGSVPVFPVKSVSPHLLLSGAVVQNTSEKTISLNFTDISNSGGSATTMATTMNDALASDVDLPKVSQSPYSGGCEVDATTGWINNAAVERKVKVGADNYLVEILIRAVQDFSADKRDGQNDAQKQK